ncbi:hypothetical protein [Telmatospirillum sp.]|uniref:hypothetical protein n=1 Tax=Telmatospirillum sp. TaxID=2079197 RepID=UPI00283D6A87|nr:hypothetical protein [Telmatospirillum sp.]MDR3437608.1 hypothetical protein [Telmatospirillum sp.]
MTARLAGLLALGLGAAFWAGYDIPLHVHMACGGLLVLSLWGLAALLGRRKPLPSLLAGAWGVLVPLAGVMQEHLFLGEGQWVLQVCHLGLGLGAIALAERLAKDLKKSATS